MSKTSTNCACGCIIGLLFIAFIAIVISTPVAVTWLLIHLQPSTPEFTLHSSSLNNASCNSQNYSSTVTADWNFTLSVINPNPKPIFYDQIIAYSSTAASNTTILPFEQKGGVEERVEIPVTFTDIVVNLNNCTGNLTVRIEARAEYGGWTWPVQSDLIKVSCLDNVGMAVNNGCNVSAYWKRMVDKWNTFLWHYIFMASIFLLILALSL